MKLLVSFVVAACVMLFGCASEIGSSGIPGQNGKDGQSSDGTPATNGEDGDRGMQGEQGPTGSPGTDNKIAKTWKCDFSVLPFGAGGAAGPNTCTDAAMKVYVWYYAAETTSGDTFVRAGIDHWASGGVKVGNSSSYFWPAGSWEGDRASNWLLHDVCAGGRGELPPPESANGNWEFLLNKASKVMSATYTDSEVDGGKIVVTIQCK